MNNIVSFKDVFDLSVILCKMHLRYDITIHWCCMLMKLSARPSGAVCRSNCQQVQPLLLFKQIMDTFLFSRLSIYCCSRFCSAICPDYFC